MEKEVDCSENNVHKKKSKIIIDVCIMIRFIMLGGVESDCS